MNSRRLDSTVLNSVQMKKRAFEELRQMVVKKKTVILHCETD